MLLKDSKAPKKRAVAGRLDSYHRGYLVGVRCGAKRTTSKPETKVRKVRKSKICKKPLVAHRLESYQKGVRLGIQRGAVQERAQQASQKSTADKARKVKSNKRSKSWAQRLEVEREQAFKQGARCGVRRERAQQAREKIILGKSRKNKSNQRSKSWAHRLEAEREEAVKNGAQCGVRRERAQQAKERTVLEEARKNRSNLRSKIWAKRLEAERDEAFKHGALRERSRATKAVWSFVEKMAPWSKPAAAPKEKAAKTSSCRGARQASDEESMPGDIAQSTSNPVFAPPASFTQMPTKCSMAWGDADDLLPAPRAARAPSKKVQGSPAPAKVPSKIGMAVGTVRKAAKLPADDVLPAAILESPTPVRAPAPKAAHSFMHDPITVKILERLKGKRAPLQLPCEQTADVCGKRFDNLRRNVQPDSAVAASQLVRTPFKAKVSTATEALSSFIEDPSGVTKESAAFQLRCKQQGQDGRKVVVVVRGKCKLRKLNHVIAECFGAGQEAFAYEPKKGGSILGSHFSVSRPHGPGQCSMVIISSASSASQIGRSSSFIDDQDVSVAQLFRGTSTGSALEREASEAAQEVMFASPLLSADVSITLDGIMLDSYDSHNLFDKNRRHGNGRRSLPRIVRSSFLSVADIEEKNVVMQGSRQGPDILQQFDSAWSAIHASCRRAQRQPLFRKDGSDFELFDLRHVSGNDESDSDVDDRPLCNK